jgi:hypothetical protein
MAPAQGNQAVTTKESHSHGGVRSLECQRCRRSSLARVMDLNY